MAGVYINERCRTDQIVDATGELAHTNLKVIAACEDKVGEINPALAPLKTPLLLHIAVSQTSIPEKLAREWAKTETWVTRLLVEAGLVTYPAHEIAKLVEHTEQTRQFASIQDARGYLNKERLKFTYLSSSKATRDMGAIRLGKVVFNENALFKRAIYENVYASVV